MAQFASKYFQDSSEKRDILQAIYRIETMMENLPTAASAPANPAGDTCSPQQFDIQSLTKAIDNLSVSILIIASIIMGIYLMHMYHKIKKTANAIAKEHARLGKELWELVEKLGREVEKDVKVKKELAEEDDKDKDEEKDEGGATGGSETPEIDKEIVTIDLTSDSDSEA